MHTFVKTITKKFPVHACTAKTLHTLLKVFLPLGEKSFFADCSSSVRRMLTSAAIRSNY